MLSERPEELAWADFTKGCRPIAHSATINAIKMLVEVVFARRFTPAKLRNTCSAGAKKTHPRFENSI